MTDKSDGLEALIESNKGKTVYEVTMYDVPVESNNEAWNMYLGYTHNKMNEGYPMDDAPCYWFFSEKDATDFVNSQCNDYYYNGHGYGWAKEWWISKAVITDDGDYLSKCLCYKSTKNSNLSDFLKEWGYDEE